jgi:sec-independent protein translocase protein TatA
MFDPSPTHIIILLVVVLLLFGSSRLPGAARSVGAAMHIFKKSVHGLDENGQPTEDPAAFPAQTSLPPAVPPQPPAQPLATQPPVADAAHHQQQQLADLQRQIADLQRQNAGAEGAAVNGGGAPLPEAQRSQQPF